MPVAASRATRNTETEKKAADGRPLRVGHVTFAEAGLRLLDNGYEPIPIIPTSKKPALSRWTAVRIDERAIESWAVQYAGHSVGLRTGRLVGVDVDVLDPDLAYRLQTLAFDRLGETLIRIGRFPKRLLLYRTDQPFAKMACGKVEILGHGQQFVSFGRHPDTQSAYSWVTGDTPLELPLDALPPVTVETMSALLAEMGALQPAQPSPRARQEKRGASTSGPIRNEAGRVIDGRDGWLSAIAFHAVHDALARGDHDVDRIVGEVWRRFSETADLGRGRNGGAMAWGPRDAKKKVTDKLRLAAQGHLPSRDIALPEPRYTLPTLSPEDARAVLEDALADAATSILGWWCGDRTSSAPQIGLRATVGLGKSTAARRHVLALCEALRSIGAPHRIAVFTPSHALAEETAAAWGAMGARVAVLRGYERADPRTGQSMCRHLPLVRAAIRAGLDVQVSACRSGTHHVCPNHDSCLKQQNRREIAGADIVVAPYDALFTGFASETDHFGLLIVDEGCWQRALTEDQISFADLAARPLLDLSPWGPRDRIDGQRAELDRARRLLTKVLAEAAEGPLTRSQLVAAGFDADLCRAASRIEAALVETPDLRPGLNAEDHRRAEATASRAETGRRVARAWTAMAELLDGAADDGGHLRIAGNAGGRHFRHARMFRIHPSLAAKPVLHLDATLRSAIARRLFPRLDVHEIDACSPHMSVHLVTGSFGKSSLCTDARTSGEEAARRERRLSECVDYVRWQALRGGQTLVITYQACEVAFAGIPGVQTGHFNAIAGLDAFGTVDRLIVIGRPLPRDSDLSPVCGALFGRQVSGGYGTRLSSVWMRDGTKCAVRAVCHQDGLAEEIRQAICEDEILQAIGRGRGVNRSAQDPLEVHVLGNLALPVVHDTVVTWEVVRPDVVQRMLLTGLAVDSPADAVALHPELFDSANQAKLAFAQAGFKGEIPIRDTYREMTLKSASYRRMGRGRGWQRAWWIEGAGQVARERLSEALGDLAGWRSGR